MYQERPSQLAGATVWQRTGTEPCRVVPDACMDLIWLAGSLVIAGPDTRAHVEAGQPGGVSGLRFAPGTATEIFGVPAHTLRDTRVPLDEVWARADVERLIEQMASARSPVTVLETVAADRLRSSTEGRRPVSSSAIVCALGANRDVAAVADAIGVSERQLHRRCLASFGYGPKMLARVLRLTRALALARTGVPFAQVAVGTGYADQAHMSREIKALAGVPLGQLTGSPAAGRKGPLRSRQGR